MTEDLKSGYGQIIITSGDSSQFALDADGVVGESGKSLFTHFLVKGLEGGADFNKDGQITVDELYNYAYEQVVKLTPRQTPTMFALKQQGKIVLCQNNKTNVSQYLRQLWSSRRLKN